VSDIKVGKSGMYFSPVTLQVIAMQIQLAAMDLLHLPVLRNKRYFYCKYAATENYIWAKAIEALERLGECAGLDPGDDIFIGALSGTRDFNRAQYWTRCVQLSATTMLLPLLTIPPEHL